MKSVDKLMVSTVLVFGLGIGNGGVARAEGATIEQHGEHQYQRQEDNGQHLDGEHEQHDDGAQGDQENEEKEQEHDDGQQAQEDGNGERAN